MRVPAVAMTHPLLGRVERGNHELISRTDEDATVQVRIDAIRLAHDGDDHNFRPYIRIRGQLESITPSYRLPGAVTGVSFTPESGPSMDIRYDFSTDQMVSMIDNGYFEEGFGIVDGVRGDSIELNTKVDFQIARHHDEQGLDVPVVFFDIEDRADMRIDEYTSGYDFTDYMHLPDREVEKYMEAEATPEVAVDRDLFSDMHNSFEQTMDFSDDLDVEPSTENESNFDLARAQVAQIEAENAPEAEAELSESERLYEAGVSSIEADIPMSDKIPGNPGVLDLDVEPTNTGLGMDLGNLSLDAVHPAEPNESKPDLLFLDEDEDGGEESERLTEPYDMTDEFVEGEISRDPAAEKAEEDASKSRVAAMLAARSQQIEIENEARKAGVDSKDISPDL